MTQDEADYQFSREDRTKEQEAKLNVELVRVGLMPPDWGLRDQVWVIFAMGANNSQDWLLMVPFLKAEREAMGPER